MKQEIKKIIPKLKGEVLIVGLDYEEFDELICKNKNINYCDFLNFTNKKKKSGKDGQVVNIRKLRKKYKSKKFNYIIVDINDIKDYLKYFIKDSIYLGKNKIYVFNNNENVLKMYKRYDVTIKTKKIKNDNYLDIDVSHATNKIIIDKVYFIFDTLINLLDKISDILVS